MLSLLVIESSRVLRPRRLIATLAACVAVATVVATQPLAPDGMSINMWDTVTDVLSIAPSAVLLLALTAYTSADVWFDREEPGIDAMIAVRSTVRMHWVAKCGAVVVGGVLVALSLWLAAVIVGAATNGVAWDWSSWGRLAFDPLGTVAEQQRRYSVPLPVAPVAATLAVAVYQGVAVAVVTSAVASVLQHRARSWHITTAVLAVAMVGLTVNVSLFNPLALVLWAAHQPAAIYVPWAPTLVMLLIIAVTTGLVGGSTLQKGRSVA